MITLEPSQNPNRSSEMITFIHSFVHSLIQKFNQWTLQAYHVQIREGKTKWVNRRAKPLEKTNVWNILPQFYKCILFCLKYYEVYSFKCEHSSKSAVSLDYLHPCDLMLAQHTDTTEITMSLLKQGSDPCSFLAGQPCLRLRASPAAIPISNSNSSDGLSLEILQTL